MKQNMPNYKIVSLFLFYNFLFILIELDEMVNYINNMNII